MNMVDEFCDSISAVMEFLLFMQQWMQLPCQGNHKWPLIRKECSHNDLSKLWTDISFDFDDCFVWNVEELIYEKT